MRYYLALFAIVLITACNETEEQPSDTKTVNTSSPAEQVTPTAAEVPQKDTLADAVLKEAAKEEPTVQAPATQKVKTIKLDTFCYVMREGDNNKNVNAVKLIIRPTDNKLIGELVYMVPGEPVARGALEGSINNNIIKANWTFIKNDTNWYRVPVEFKRTGNAVLQKPSAIDENGQPYVPEDGEYSFQFDLVDCKFFPE